MRALFKQKQRNLNTNLMKLGKKLNYLNKLKGIFKKKLIIYEKKKWVFYFFFKNIC